jgi:FKBP-type peptidyl-prolyl cis-trans isomerase
MKMKLPARIYFLVIILPLALFFSCSEQSPGERSVSPTEARDPLIKANQEAVRFEQQQIDDFIARYRWSMESTPTGIRYMFINRGGGARAEKGRVVELEYTLTLLNGDTVYTSREKGPMKFRAGQGQVVSGLEEAILFMRVGDRAKFIIPSHLAFGLIGDQDKITHKATLVYDLNFTAMY